MKGRYLITEKQLKEINSLLIDGNARKALLKMHHIQVHQFIGESDKDEKEDLQKFRHSL